MKALTKEIIARLEHVGGDSIEFEIYEDPTTGKQYHVDIEIKRFFDSAQEITED